jgi:rhodanese-related sulfurtransferase
MSHLELTPPEAQPQLTRYRIIDVRESHEFNGPLGYVKNAEHIPLSTIEQNAERLAGGPPLLLICRSGKRSGIACESLEKLGVRNVTNLVGGMIAWHNSDLPAERATLHSCSELLNSIIAWLTQVTATSQAAATGRIDALLHEAGTSSDHPTASGLDHVLDGLRRELRTSGAPPDLDITVDAYRKDLSIL